MTDRNTEQKYTSFLGADQKTCRQSYYRMNMREPGDFSTVLRCCGESVIRNPFCRQFAFARDFEVIFILGGEIDAVIDGREYRMTPGDVLCRRPNTDFILKTPEPMQSTVDYYWLHFDGGGASMTVDTCAITCNQPFRIDRFEAVIEDFESLFLEFRRRRADFDYATGVTLGKILLALGRRRLDSEKAPLDRTVKYIHASLRKKITVGELAAMEYLSVSHYREKFRKLMGMSPNEYIIGLKIMKAKDLLRIGNLSLRDVASSVGFDDVHYFQRVFKKMTGLTPGEFRKNELENL